MKKVLWSRKSDNNKKPNINNQLWCESTINPAPCCDKAKFITFSVARWQQRTASRFLAMLTNADKEISIAASRGFFGIGPKLNQVVPWSMHTFPKNFMQIGPAVFS